jgi:pSer/pThr/pTyr-binding forkhead associated (FHA) protein
MPRLVCTHGNNSEEVFAIKEGVNRVGRCPDTGIMLFDKACSRAHAEIYRKGDAISIEDLGSRHGTFVNGKRISHRIRLHLGDRVDIGHTVLKLSEGEDRVVRKASPTDGALSPETQTQEINQRLLAGETELALTPPSPPPPEPAKANLLRRLFGGGDGNGNGSGSGESKG